MMPQLEATLDPRRSTAIQPRRAAASYQQERDSETIRTNVDRDGELTAALRRGEPSATEQLVATYGHRAYRLAIRITGNEPDAEEAVQDAFWAVVRKIDTFRGDAAFGSWLYRIVANAAYQKLRGRQSRHRDLSLDEILPFFDEQGRHRAPMADWSTRVDDPTLQGDLRSVLTAAIDQLPADYRTAFVLRDVEGLSNRQIGEALGISLANVKTRVHRARLFLRRHLGTYMAVETASDEIA